MSEQTYLKCDICGLEENERDIHSESTIKVKAKAGWRLWWWHGRADYSSIEICDACTDLIYALRRQNDLAIAMNRIVAYRGKMCGSDSTEFDISIQEIAKDIDRYRDDNRKLYETIKGNPSLTKE